MYSLTRLDKTRHMFRWLSDDPYADILKEVSSLLTAQVPGSQLKRFVVLAKPDWLTSGRPGRAGPNKAVMMRVGVAFPFVLDVFTPDDGLYTLRGVYTWITTGLDQPTGPRQRVWLDLDGTMKGFGASGALSRRLFTHDAPALTAAS